MTLQIRKAARKQAKLRIGLSGTSGSGKTYSALLLAHGMTNDWSKICVIDTENKSADLYADLGEYSVITLNAPFAPERYIEAIHAAEDSGMEVIIIDSISHEWEGKGGCLELQEKLGGRYQDWAKITPRHRAFIDAILQSQAHIITTVRRKQDYDMVNENGKMKVQKCGLKEVTREGYEYELTINFEIDQSHNATASKDRTRLFIDKPSEIISDTTGKKLLDWANSGEKIEFMTEEQRVEIVKLSTSFEEEKFISALDAYYGKSSINELTKTEASDLIKKLSKKK